MVEIGGRKFKSLDEIEGLLCVELSTAIDGTCAPPSEVIQPEPTISSNSSSSTARQSLTIADMSDIVKMQSITGVVKGVLFVFAACLVHCTERRVSGT